MILGASSPLPLLVLLLTVAVSIALYRGRKGTALALGVGAGLVAAVAASQSRHERNVGGSPLQEAAQELRDVFAEVKDDLAESKRGRRSYAVADGSKSRRSIREAEQMRELVFAPEALASVGDGNEPADAAECEHGEPAQTYEEQSTVELAAQAEQADTGRATSPRDARAPGPAPVPPQTPQPPGHPPVALGPRHVRPGLWLERLPVRMADGKVVIDARAVLPRRTNLQDPTDLPTEKEIAAEIREQVFEQLQEFFEEFTAEPRPRDEQMRKLHAELRKLDVESRAELARSLAERKAALRQREIRDTVVPGIGPSYERTMVAEFPADQLQRLILEQRGMGRKTVDVERGGNSMPQFLLLVVSLAVATAWLRSATHRHAGIVGPPAS